MTKADCVEFENEQIYLIGPMLAMQRALTTVRRFTRRPERMALIIGDQGMGKTVASRYFASLHDDVSYIEVPPAAVLRPRRILQLVEQAIEMPMRSHGTLWEGLMGIVDQLRREPRMLIFDEADRLRRHDYIDLLRHMHDAAGVRIAFVSVPALSDRFRRYPEFTGRLHLYHQLKPATRDEVHSVLPDFSAQAVDAIFEFSGGRMREVMVLAEHFRMDEIPVKERTPDRVRRVARAVMLRAS